MFGFLARARRCATSGGPGGSAVSAILLITLSLAALGGFWLLSFNLGQAVAQWRERVRSSSTSSDEPPAAEANALAERVGRMPGVASGCATSARPRRCSVLKRSLGKDADVADQLPRNPLPASLEITPTAEGATPEGARALVTRLAALPEVDEIGGRRGLGRALRPRASVCSRLFGLGVGAVLALAAILTVTTATTLVLHARRDEMEIMRLVGAPEHVDPAAAAAAGHDAGAHGRRCWPSGVLIVCYALAGAAARAAAER